MTGKVCLLLLVSLAYLDSHAQEKQTKTKKVQQIDSASNPGFKKLSGVRQSRAQNPVISSAESSKPRTSAPARKENMEAFAGSVEEKSTEKRVLFNYNKLSQEVRQRIDANKSSGRPEMDGICRRFNIQMAGILTTADISSKLGKVLTARGINKVGFLSPGNLYILADPALSSEEIKELCSSTNLDFDFLKEEFCLIP